MPGKRMLPGRVPMRALGLGTGLLVLVSLMLAADVVPTDVQLPGTQPGELPSSAEFTSVGNCGCHSFNQATGVPADSVPVFGWTGGMMANSGRDPLFWSTVAVAEQDFLPGGGGVGDLCLHCHSVKGWTEGRSTPTDGFGLDPATDGEGIMCEFCHFLTNPDMHAQYDPVNNPPPEGSYIEAQTAPFVAYDDDLASPTYGEGYYGGAEYVTNAGGTRLGPYDDHGAKHDAIPSAYHRDARLCGTCHDVSNPAVGDLAPNHGAMVPLPGTFSGVPGTPVDGKAAFNNPPESYGIVERTYSEWVASAYDTTPVSGFPGLPADIRTPGGAVERAYQAALWGTCSVSGDLCNLDANCPGGETCLTFSTDYQQSFVTPATGGQTRYYTCQTCHMSPTGGDGAQQGRGKNNTGDPWVGEIRPDLPRHDQTGMSYWQHDLIQWQDEHGTLRFGDGLTYPSPEFDAARARSEAHLRSAASLSALQVGGDLVVRVTNLTGHKLISGYPEGRRMWLNVKWFDGEDALVREDGAYGPLHDDLGDPVEVVNPVDSGTYVVQSIIDPDSTKVYEAKPAITKEWADVLLAVGYPSDMILEWDRETDLPEMTLQELADSDPGDMEHTFHFVLNNAVEHDNRIPPYGFDFDEAERRSALPVPSDQYGNPGPGGVYQHWDDVSFAVPPGAVRAEVRLYYQATSWEYVQFLWKQPTSNPLPTSTFLADEGAHMLDAWLNTGMAAPFEMATIALGVTPVGGVPGEASHFDVPAEQMVAAYDAVSGLVDVTFTPACDATGYALYYGDLSAVSAHGYSGAVCLAGAASTASFDPGPGSSFFLVVAHNGSNEGSYGEYNRPSDGLLVERPEAVGVAVCDFPQDLTGVTCEP